MTSEQSTCALLMPLPLEQRCVLLFGEALVDSFPDRDIPGGAPFNVAHHLKRLGTGLDPVLVTRIGTDERGGQLLEAMRASGLTTEGVQRDLLRPTGVVNVEQDETHDGHRFVIPVKQAWDFIHADVARLIALSRRPTWMYFGTLAQRGGSRHALRALMHALPMRTFLDLNLRDPWVTKDVIVWSLAHARYVKVNDDELRRIGRLLDISESAPSAIAGLLLKRFGNEALLMTRGEQGALLILSDGTRHEVMSDGDVEVVDTVGAGDAFASVFMIGLALNWPLALALERAQRFAGAVCGVRGAIPESHDFYQPFIKDWQLKQERTA